MSERLRELLVKAVRRLDQHEQDELLGELLISGGSSRAGLALNPLARRTVPVAHDALAERVSVWVDEGSDLKMLPVRLPVDDYERLRTWSRENRFSMAVIIRTLVERFLDGQERAAPSGGPGGSA